MERPSMYDFECRLKAHPDWQDHEDTGYARRYRHVDGHWVSFMPKSILVGAYKCESMSWPKECVCWHVAVRLYARRWSVPDLVSILMPLRPAFTPAPIVNELRSTATGHLP